MEDGDANRERFILSVLRRLARQRVALLLQPGDVWVIEYAVEDEKNVAEALRTCHMRGWVEPLAHALPTGKVAPNGTLPEKLFTTEKPLYRLTDSGWSAIHRTHSWDVFACTIAGIGLIVSLSSLIVAVIALHRT